MFKFLCKKKAQSSLEYAILIIIVLGALLSIQLYIRRGIQGRLRSATDDIGEQYSAGNMNIVKTTTFYTKSHDEAGTANAGGVGGTKSTLDGSETMNVELTQTIHNLQFNYK